MASDESTWQKVIALIDKRAMDKANLFITIISMVLKIKEENYT